MSEQGWRRTVDAVTLTRIPVAVVLPLAPSAWRLPMFTVAAATDAVDGWLARRLHVASDRGARLDSVADLFLVVGTAVALVETIPTKQRGAVAIGAGVVAATRVICLVTTRRRFGRWAVMHTDLNRATGLTLAAVTIVTLARGRLPLTGAVCAGAVGQWSALDELAIVSRAEAYEPDRRRR